MAKTASRPRPHDRMGRDETSSGRDGFRLAGRLWIEKDGETYLGWGRVVLLERIRETGSINAAAKTMGMGYRHAWDLVDMMNRLSPKPLVRKATGGRRGGGSVLTTEGEAAVANFWALVTEFRRWMEVFDPRLWKPPPPARRR